MEKYFKVIKENHWLLEFGRILKSDCFIYNQDDFEEVSYGDYLIQEFLKGRIALQIKVDDARRNKIKKLIKRKGIYNSWALYGDEYYYCVKNNKVEYYTESEAETNGFENLILLINEDFKIKNKEEKEERKEDKMNKFEVGDMVVIKSWGEMKEEFGINDSGNINCCFYFTTNMIKYCEEVAKVVALRDEKVILEFDNKEMNPNSWNFSTDMIKPIEWFDKSQTERKGNTMRTLLYLKDDIVGEGVARCHPTDDKFNYKTGLDISFERAIEDMYNRRKPKRGEGLVGQSISKGTRFRVINLKKHEEVCESQAYIGKIAKFNSSFVFTQNGYHSSGKFEKEYMNAIDLENGQLCFHWSEVELLD